MVSAKIVGERVARIGKPDVDVERVSTRLELAKGCKFGKSGRFMMLPLAPASRDVEKTPCGCVSPQGCRVEQKQTQGGFWMSKMHWWHNTAFCRWRENEGRTALDQGGRRSRAYRYLEGRRGRAWTAVYRSCQNWSYLPEVLVESSRLGPSNGYGCLHGTRKAAAQGEN